MSDHKSRALFIGSNPSQKAQSSAAFTLDTQSGRTLHKWIEDAEINISVCINLATIVTPNNRPLNKKEINKSLVRLSRMLDQNRGMPVVAVGKTAATALTLLGVSFYELPHPSGLNRLLNDPEYVAQKIKGLVEHTKPSKIE